ncbi:MAG: glycosyltransferase family 2 protein [Oscillospiraceae bacterium]|nr:glycosyltransferase family 2 protein [Oscillospiraceae bacterium]
MDKGSKPVPEWANKNQIVKLAYKTVRMLKNEGFSQTVFAAKYVTRRWQKLRQLKKDFYLSEEKRAAQEATVFSSNPKISLITPLYNTDERHLREMIESVMAQSYKNWQLCLADGSDDEHAYVGEVARRCAEADGRISYKKLEKNLGIAGNVNAAIEMSEGDYIARLDHDDLLAEGALFEIARAVEEGGYDFIYTDEATFINKPSDSRSMHFKPCWSPDFMRACNYVCHLMAARRSLVERSGGYDSAFDGSEDYDFTLRLSELSGGIKHIALPLYYWRIHAGSVADDISAKPYAYDAARRAVQAHIGRLGLKGEVVYSKAVPMMRVIYEIAQPYPLVSIIIPSCDHSEVLRRCIDSIYEKSSYKNFEIIICENNSREKATFDYYETLEKEGRARVVKWEGAFNFSAINNFARGFAKGEQLLFLNNDIEVITPGWLEEMLMFTQRPDVGACGIKLLYPNNTVQHGGIAVGICGSAANLCPLFPREHEGYMSRLAVASDMSACTAACLMVRSEVFDETGGFDEELAVAFNDVDLCLKIRDRGYLVVFNPVAECYHYESRSRGYDKKGAKKARMEREKELLRQKWPEYFEGEGDPYYNRNFGKNSISYDA